MIQWDYHQELAPWHAISGTCQAAGKDGWELCGMLPVNLASSMLAGAEQVPGALLMFKRPAPEAAAHGENSHHNGNQLLHRSRIPET